MTLYIEPNKKYHKVDAVITDTWEDRSNKRWTENDSNSDIGDINLKKIFEMCFEF